MIAQRRLVVFVNPQGGKRRALPVWERIKPVFTEAGIESDVRVTQHPGHAAEMTCALDLAHYEGICIIGGDGTVHEVADALMQRGEPTSIPLGIIPAGTGNTLAQHLQCTDPFAAARHIAQGRTAPLDVMRVTLSDCVVYCVDIVGWGGVADINHTAERLRFLGSSRYGVSALWQILRAKRRRATLVLDGQSSEDEFLFVIACNPKFTGSGMKLAPRAELGDGLMDVVVVRRASRLQMLRLFTKVFDGSHVLLDYVEYHQVRSFAIDCLDQRLLDLDGEMKGRTPLSVDVLPSALRVFGE